MELPTSIASFFHQALAQGLEVLGSLSLGENSLNNKFELLEEEWNSLLEEVNVHNMEKEKLRKRLLDKEVALKVMTLFVVDWERSLNCLETKKTSLIKTG